MKSALFPLLGLLLGGCAGAPKTEADVFDDITQLTADVEAVKAAAFTSDMKWVVFQAEIGSEPGDQLFVARVLTDGNRIVSLSPRVRITPKASLNQGGRFSDDGVSLIFASTGTKISPTTRPTKNDLDLFRADGWQAAIAAVQPGRGVNLAKHALTNDDAFDGQAFYARSGHSIFFLSSRAAMADKADDVGLYVMRADGTDVLQLMPPSDAVGRAVVTPDGRQIQLGAKVRDSLNGTYGRVFDLIFDPTGKIAGMKPASNVQSFPIPAAVESWHADGIHVVTADKRDGSSGNLDLAVVRTDGSHPLRITFNAAKDYAPIFSRDGMHLAWISTRGKAGTPQLFIGKFKMPKAG